MGDCWGFGIVYGGFFVQRLLLKELEKDEVRCGFVNGMACGAKGVMQACVESLGLTVGKEGAEQTLRDAVGVGVKSRVRRRLARKKGGDGVVLVLDEVDSLLRNRESILRLFRMPCEPNSRLVLLAISNTLDLPTRSLPELRTLGVPLRELSFPPYDANTMLQVLQHRLNAAIAAVETQSGTEGACGPLIDPAALRFCAITAVKTSSDVRKALRLTSSILSTACEGLLRRLLTSASSPAQVSTLTKKLVHLSNATTTHLQYTRKEDRDCGGGEEGGSEGSGEIGRKRPRSTTTPVSSSTPSTPRGIPLPFVSQQLRAVSRGEDATLAVKKLPSRVQIMLWVVAHLTLRSNKSTSKKLSSSSTSGAYTAPKRKEVLDMFRRVCWERLMERVSAADAGLALQHLEERGLLASEPGAAKLILNQPAELEAASNPALQGLVSKSAASMHKEKEDEMRRRVGEVEARMEVEQKRNPTMFGQSIAPE